MRRRSPVLLGGSIIFGLAACGGSSAKAQDAASGRASPLSDGITVEAGYPELEQLKRRHIEPANAATRDLFSLGENTPAPAATVVSGRAAAEAAQEEDRTFAQRYGLSNPLTPDSSGEQADSVAHRRLTTRLETRLQLRIDRDYKSPLSKARVSSSTSLLHPQSVQQVR